MAGRTERSELRDSFLFFGDEGSKRKESLNKVRVETVVEMSLEPITGLKLEEYALQIDRVMMDESLSDLSKAMALEDVMRKLYNNASTKVVYTSADASVLLDKLSQESFKRSRVLAALEK